MPYLNDVHTDPVAEKVESKKKQRCLACGQFRDTANSQGTPHSRIKSSSLVAKGKNKTRQEKMAQARRGCPFSDKENADFIANGMQ